MSGFSVQRRGAGLVLDLGETCRVLSWAIAGGGARRARHVVWRQVMGDELRPPVEPARLLQDYMDALAHGDAVGLLTSFDVRAYVERVVTRDGVTAQCVATVGLGSALRAGDPPLASAQVGTINIVCHVSESLTPEALVEALALASEAKALAVREAGISSGVSGRPASGTGTDCIVLAASDGGAHSPYAGKHTAIGHVIGASVHDAVREGATHWRPRPCQQARDGGERHA